MAKEKKSKFEINFAEDPQIAEKLVTHFTPRIKSVRTNRQILEDNWLRFFNMWNVTKDSSHSYLGRAQLYIPEVRKNVEAQARQLTKSAFPGEDFFDVSPGLTGSTQGALAWKSLQKWAMSNCQLSQKYFVAMRQMCLLGTTPIYLPWRKTVRKEFRSRRQGQKILPTKQEIELFNGPDFIVRDLFRWYTFNPKLSDLSEGCFEVNPISYFELLRRQKKEELVNLESILAGASAYSTEEFNMDVLRADAEGINIQTNLASMGEAVIRKDGDENPQDQLYMHTRIFADIIMSEACEDDEDPDLPIPMMIDLYGNDTCGQAKRNPFYHQQPPYVVGTYIPPNVDEFYGQGIPWAIQFMQYEMNAKSEQGMDSGTYALNPLAIIDPGLAGASNEFNVEPGAIWWANPAGVKLAAMPDTSPVAYQAVQHLKSLMQDYSDRSPALPPQLQGKSRSATQSQIVDDALSVDNWLFQMQNENRILIPMMQQWEAITDQNMDDDMLVLIMGRKAGDLKRTMIARSDLLGRYAYQWKGGTAAQNKQIVARQMLDFLKVMTMIPPGSSLPNFNYTEFVKTLYTEMWSLPNPEKILGLPETMASQDAEAENKMITMGLEIEVLPMDEDEEHLRVHDEAMKKTKGKIEQMLLMTHMLIHKKQMEQKQMIQQQKQQQQQLMMQMQMMQSQSGGKKAGSGNRTQMSSNATTGDQASGVRA